MADLEKIELHDAVLSGMTIDYSLRVATVGLEFYSSEEERHRHPALITFHGIESISQICDLDQLAKNASPGNVNYWIPAEEGGTTYIYLVDGCLAIKAMRVAMKTDVSGA